MYRILLLTLTLTLSAAFTHARERLIFNGDFSPAEGLVTPAEKPLRDEICLNGQWDFQPVAIPSDWIAHQDNAPELTAPEAGKWENVKIKIPSPWNVNEWGAGSNVGEGTDAPYAPSSVYYPSYPKSWGGVNMGWLRRMFTVPESWNKQKVILHFEAVAGASEVYVNGIKVAENYDRHLPFEADITEAVNFEGENELLVGVRQLRIFDKKHTESGYFNAADVPGFNTPDLAGIWQDVFLHSVPNISISNVLIKPLVSQNSLEIDVEVTNKSARAQKLILSGDVREWLNMTKKDDPVTAAEIDWKLGSIAMRVISPEFTVLPGETHQVTLKTPVNSKLKLWSPDTPNLYSAVLNINQKKRKLDTKSTRFGWREFTVAGSDFHLNGKKIQYFGDNQHPFGAYICSRRFAWAWYTMIKDFGGNAVRLHAQPWPRVYYDLADEMGLIVLDAGNEIYDIAPQNTPPKEVAKPLLAGKSGAASPGRPKELYRFVGERAYESYEGLNEGLAINIYQNVVRRVKPQPAFYPPLEVCWFGIEHLNLGYSDYSRLPDENDGVYAGKPYEEGKPGYQIERIPPYVTTFNPGIDPSLPLYKELPMFNALKGGVLDVATKWAISTRHKMPTKPVIAASIYREAYFIGDMQDSLAVRLTEIGIKLSNNANAPLVIIDGEKVSADQIEKAKKAFAANKSKGGLILVMVADSDVNEEIKKLLPYHINTTSRTATAMESNKNSKWGGYFTLPELYFADARPAQDRKIMRQGLSGEFVSKGTVALIASRTDWSLFNDNAQNRKCAQIVLYEHLLKPEGAALVSAESGRGTVAVSTIDYRIDNNETRLFWADLFSVMGISINTNAGTAGGALPQRPRDPLLDGPIGK